MTLEAPDAEASPDPRPEPRFIRIASTVEITLAALLFLVLFIGVIWQVLGRYFPAMNWPGAGEIARYSLMGITFIMVGYLIAKNGQITVAVIDNIVGPRWAATVRFISSGLLAIICLWLTWEAWALFSDGFRRSTAVLQIPFGYLFLLPLVGFVSGTLMAVVKMVRAREPEPDRLVLEEEIS